MSKNKTNPGELSVEQFLNAIEDEQKRTDSQALIKLMQEITGTEPRMWGSSIIGFGSYHYKYASGREGDAVIAGFSPRKAAITLYNMEQVINEHGDLLQKLGKHTLGNGCLYIKRLTDVDAAALQQVIETSVKHVNELAKKGS